MAQLMLVNPRKRRRVKAKRKSNPKKRRSLSAFTKRHIRRRRRNPIGGVSTKNMMQTFQGGAVGAAGALAVDVAMSKLPLPANLTTGTLAPITKGFVGIGVGMIVSKFLKNKRLGEQLANGAVTVALYNAGKQMIGPSLGLSGYDSGLLGYDSGLLGYSDFSDDSDLGWYSTEPVSPWDSDEMNGYSQF